MSQKPIAPDLGGTTAETGHPLPPKPTAFFGHPAGLGTLFFTELWERFSYYGMRAILVLYMTALIADGGMGLSTVKAAAIYGLYTASVYLLALPGGFVADRLIGQQNAILIGGLVIAAGHFSMAFPSSTMFFAGLVLIVIGTGLLKPNISAIVGELYPEGGARRDAGFSIFYMGINIGAFISPIIVGWLGEEVDWHMGFAAAGIGMVIGTITFVATRKNLGGAGNLRTDGLTVAEAAQQRRGAWTWLAVGMAVFAGVLAVIASGRLPIESIAEYTGYAIAGMAALFFIYVLFFGHLNSTEKKRVCLIGVLFIFSAIFWAGFEQAGSSLNIFARDMTDRMFGGWEMPASWLQSVNALFIIILAPVFAAIWTGLKHRNPSIPVKFALGLIQLAIGFFVIMWAAAQATDGNLVSPAWLVVMYFFHTTGELCLSPVGLSSVTKLAPRKFASQMMGVWFISVSLGNLLAGLVAGTTETLPMADLFHFVAMVTGGAGILLLVMSPLFRKLAEGVD